MATIDYNIYEFSGTETELTGVASIPVFDTYDSNIYDIESVEILDGGTIDDYGIIGAILFDNNTPCSEITTIAGITLTELDYSVNGNNVEIPWSASSDAACGPPTVIDAMIRVTLSSVSATTPPLVNTTTTPPLEDTTTSTTPPLGDTTTSTTPPLTGSTTTSTTTSTTPPLTGSTTTSTTTSTTPPLTGTTTTTPPLTGTTTTTTTTTTVKPGPTTTPDPCIDCTPVYPPVVSNTPELESINPDPITTYPVTIVPPVLPLTPIFTITTTNTTTTTTSTTTTLAPTPRVQEIECDVGCNKLRF